MLVNNAREYITSANSTEESGLVRTTAIVNRFLIAALSVAGLKATQTDHVRAAPQKELWKSTRDVVVTGTAQPHLKSFDRMMVEFLQEHSIPGAALAVSAKGRLVYERGFGYADVEAKEPVQPSSLFRIASLSKPITAVAVLQLIEQNRLKLDDKVFQLLKLEPHLPRSAPVDPRLKKVTVRQLLQHTGGWDRAKSFDPMFRSVEIARTLGVVPPAKPEHVIRYMIRRPLDFDPGQRYAYSNFGYCLLGRVIEHVSGQTYEQFVREQVLAPLGIRGMRIGKTRLGERDPAEVTYYVSDGRTGPSVFGSDVGKPVPQPYGAWCLESMDSHGGWIACAADLVRFASAFDDPHRCQILKPPSIETMFARPQGLAGFDASGRPKPSYYACGWSVRPVGTSGRLNTWHMGGLPGTSTILVRRHDGLNWAVLFNTRDTASRQAPATLIDGLVHRAANAVKTWPAGKR